MNDVDLDLVSADEKPRLSEVLDFESEIAPYPLTMIYAGLGCSSLALHGTAGHKPGCDIDDVREPR